jgi:hypothetical protein
MQVARRRWSAVLIAGSACTPKGACMRVWLSQAARALQGGLGSRVGVMRVRAGSPACTSGR